MPLLRQFIEVQSELRSEAVSHHSTKDTPVFQLDKIQPKDVHAPSFTVMTYNVCAISILLQDGGLGSDRDGKTSNHFKWKKRKDSFMNELIQYKPDILCLQEIQTWKDSGHWADLLLEMGYDYDVYCTTKPRPTLSYQTTGNNRNLYGQAIAWKKERFRRVAYEPFFFDKAPQSHPTDITPFTGAMVQFSMLEYLYEPPPPQKTFKEEIRSSNKFVIEGDPYDDFYVDDDEFFDEDEELGTSKDDGDCVSRPTALYPFKVHKSASMPRFAVFIANTKFLDLKGYEYERLRMMYILLSQLEIFQAEHQSQFIKATKCVPSSFPHIICGDLGFTPHSPTYQHIFKKSSFDTKPPPYLKSLESSYKSSFNRALRLGFGIAPLHWALGQPPSSWVLKLKSLDTAPRNKLPLSLLLSELNDLTYRFELSSAYRGYQQLMKCFSVEKKIQNLRKTIIESHEQNDWAPIGAASNDWGDPQSSWVSDDAWSSTSNTTSHDSGWGASSINSSSKATPLPFHKEEPTKMSKMIHPNETMDMEIVRIKDELKNICLIDNLASEDPSSGEPVFTRFMDSNLDTTDYILYSSITSKTIENKKRYAKNKELRVAILPMHLLSVPEVEEAGKSIPNAIFPSDHICLATRFSVVFHPV